MEWTLGDKRVLVVLSLLEATGLVEVMGAAARLLSATAISEHLTDEEVEQFIAASLIEDRATMDEIKNAVDNRMFKENV